MSIEETIAFIADTRVKADQYFAKSERCLDRIERSLAQTKRMVGGQARSGVSLRNQVRELQGLRARSKQFRARTEENWSEITDKLDALVDLVEELQKVRVRSEESQAKREENRARERFQVRTKKNLAEITDKLNALSNIVDRSLRRNGGSR